ncbi:MAG: permease prefix domain 1-containing protein [Planctomycetota bacterium]
MSITQRLTSLAHDLRVPVSVSEAEIREELEFHLQMRTADNEACGMDADTARRDAELRFGDLERSFRACRRESLGIRLWWQRLQLLLIIGLGITVIALGLSLGRLQAEYESRIATLRRSVQAAEAAALAPAIDNRIPYRQWRWPVPTSASIDRWANATPASSVTGPWCDWSSLETDP